MDGSWIIEFIGLSKFELREVYFDGVEGDREVLLCQIFMIDISLVEFHGVQVGQYFIDPCFYDVIEGLDVMGGRQRKFEGLLIHLIL